MLETTLPMTENVASTPLLNTCRSLCM